MEIPQGTTSRITELFLPDASVVTGAGKRGLVYNTSGLTCYYKRNTGGASVAVTLADATLGTWTSGGFKEVDGTFMVGLYEFGIPNAALVSGAEEVIVYFQGATDMVPTPLRIALIVPNIQQAIGLRRNAAFTALPFYMYDNVFHLPVAGKTVTVQRRIDGGAYATGGLTNIVDAGDGSYEVDGIASDMNGTFVRLKATATGCDTTFLTIVTVP